MAVIVGLSGVISPPAATSQTGIDHLSQAEIYETSLWSTFTGIGPEWSSGRYVAFSDGSDYIADVYILSAEIPYSGVEIRRHERWMGNFLVRLFRQG